MAQFEVAAAGAGQFEHLPERRAKNRHVELVEK